MPDREGATAIPRGTKKEMASSISKNMKMSSTVASVEHNQCKPKNPSHPMDRPWSGPPSLLEPGTGGHAKRGGPQSVQAQETQQPSGQTMVVATIRARDEHQRSCTTWGTTNSAK
jgi:hypothetical protein